MLQLYFCQTTKGVEERWMVKQRVHKMERGCYSENTLPMCAFLCKTLNQSPYVNFTVKSIFEVKKKSK